MAAANKSELVEAVVAPGRSVHLEVQKYPVWNGEKMIEASRPGKAAGPGEIIMLPQPEAERLQALGFLVKPGVPALPTGNGPTFSASDGPSITEPN